VPGPQPIDRRTFLAEMGRGAFVVAVLTLVGCGPEAIASLVPSPSPALSAEPSPAGASDEPSSGPPATAHPPGSPPPGGVSWARVNLGFVSAYVLVRGGEAALVDTGVGGSADAIEATLTSVGVGWANVGHVILTHHHNDHQGSIRTVVEKAPDATVYTGAEDVSSILVEPVSAVGDGDSVFDLRIVTTPGHTAGSISVLDPIAGVLVAGDAMGTKDGLPTLPNAANTVNMAQAKQSIVKLGSMTFETLLVGHGNPIEGGAAALVAELGAAG
jgi:glyoxylase-like metal-dependent hydrolase (beta-lactamase superfamily II)